MRTHSLKCRLTLNGFLSTPEPVGVLELRIKQRHQVGVLTREEVEMVAEDFDFPEVQRLFTRAVDEFSHPQRRRVHVLNILASLQLGLQPSTLDQMTRETLSLMEELLEMSGGNGFRMVGVMDVLQLDREDTVDLSEQSGSNYEDDEDDDDEETEEVEEDDDDIGNGGGEMDGDDEYNKGEAEDGLDLSGDGWIEMGSGGEEDDCVSSEENAGKITDEEDRRR